MKTSLLQLNAGRRQAAEQRRAELLEELATVEDRLEDGEESDNEPSCAHYKACGHFHSWQQCQCTSSCHKYGNCCSDYDSYCAAHTPAPTPEPKYEPFRCQSSTDFGAVVQPERKGMALDDTTFENCADQIPTHWPNTDQKILSMRLFKPWGMTAPKFFHGDYHKAWVGLKGWAQATNGQFLLGISVTCQKYNDEKEWRAGQEFIKYVGAEHIMGVAIGNEIDLQVGASNGHCIDQLWNKGGYERIIKQRVEEFEKIPGMEGKPISAVLSMQSMGQYPFIYKVKKFLNNVWKTWGKRFYLSINVYPQFNHGLTKGGCHGSAMAGTSYDTSDPDHLGFMPNLVKDIRKRMALVGGGDKKLWIGETGWATHAYCVLNCYEACRSPATQKRFYTNFLTWDMESGLKSTKCGVATGKCKESIDWITRDGIYGHPEWFPGLTNESTPEEFQDFQASGDKAGCPHTCAWEKAHPSEHKEPMGSQGADHVFYFTLRDSSVFGQHEEFGIVKRCGDTRCKF